MAVECATEVNSDIPIYLNSLLIYTNIMSEHWLNDVNVSVPVNGSRDCQLCKPPGYIVTCGGLGKAFMLRQLTGLTAGG